MEVVVFGPGYGESIVMHIGLNKWIIVDSCYGPDKKPVSLKYLEEQNVPPENIVEVICTHWHDDHIKGISEVLDHAKNAKFTCSAALDSDHFIALAGNNGYNISSASSSGVTEFFKVFEIAISRNTPFQFAQEESVIYSDPENEIFIYALSPSQSAVKLSHNAFDAMKLQGQAHRGRLKMVKPNHTSVVTQIKIKGHEILLGADLEESGKFKGWSTIIESKSKNQVNASVFKIPHHGSPNGDHDSIWTHLLESNPLSVVTPYPRGKKRPQPEDVARMKTRTRNLFLTSRRQSKELNRSGISRKLIYNTVTHIQPVQYCTGYVKFSLEPKTQQWQHHLFGTACRL